MADKEEKLCDLRFLAKFTDGDPEKLEKYIAMFLHFMPAFVEKIEKGLEEKNWPVVAISASLIKGQMVYMGIKNQDHVLRIIEITNSKKPSLKELKEEINQVRLIMNSAIGELTPQMGKSAD